MQGDLECGSGAQRNGATGFTQRLQRIASDVQQHLFDLIRVVRQLRQARVVVAYQRYVIRLLQRHQLADSLRHLMNTLSNVLAWPLRAQQAIDQIAQAVGLFNDHLGVFGQRRIGQSLGQQLCRTAQPAKRIFNLMRQATNQIAGGNLLSVLQLFLAQAALVIHRRQFDQDIAFRQRLGGQGEDMRAPVNHQGHFAIGKALAGAQALTHQIDIQREIAEQIG
ncbi:hypothetical protein D3C78_1033240 [compost metagenome]